MGLHWPFPYPRIPPPQVLPELTALPTAPPTAAPDSSFLDEVERQAQWVAGQLGVPLWAVWVLGVLAALLAGLPCAWGCLELRCEAAGQGRASPCQLTSSCSDRLATSQ